MAAATAGARDIEKLGANHFILEVKPDIAVGAFSACSGLAMEREVLEYREGGRNDVVHRLPGRMKYPNLVLKRGITDQRELMRWFWDSRSVPKLVTVTVKLVDTTGHDMQVWAFAEAYPVKWTGPSLDAGSDAAATEELEIAHGGLVL
jgi:phage tail-like protein